MLPQRRPGPTLSTLEVEGGRSRGRALGAPLSAAPVLLRPASPRPALPRPAYGVSGFWIIQVFGPTAIYIFLCICFSSETQGMYFPGLPAIVIHNPDAPRAEKCTAPGHWISPTQATYCAISCESKTWTNHGRGYAVRRTAGRSGDARRGGRDSGGLVRPGDNCTFIPPWVAKPTALENFSAARRKETPCKPNRGRQQRTTSGFL